MCGAQYYLLLLLPSHLTYVLYIDIYKLCPRVLRQDLILYTMAQLQLCGAQSYRKRSHYLLHPSHLLCVSYCASYSKDMYENLKTKQCLQLYYFAVFV